ncbi:unnamed protein product [Paramecium primaurelia]|uniref:Uncharacterized protein n=2 Tax=Paramecium TaxID=5884 RepID=A0A8S1SJS4_9CILI|nr:unnamed protein product [Paramecium primaurelia]CAD8139529.1 unnamed protein product [Paramecium pentaurelia]
MGCSVQKQKDERYQQNNLESILQMQIKELVQKQQQEQQDTLGDQDELSIYDQSLEKQVKVPKLRQPIYNTIVQRRKLQQYDGIVKQNIELR